jgi:hypothetical protein
MNKKTIRLHEVETGQGIPPDALTRLRMQRLNFFPDRPLGDDEFDRMQAWSDHRMAALENSLQQPGILEGLECHLYSVNEQNDEGELEFRQIIQLFPGRGLGQNRQLYVLQHPLEQEWKSLAQRFQADPETPEEALNGLYLVVLDADFFHMDVMPNREPCRRDELDRLRDARIQRGLMLSLVQVDTSLWILPEVEEKPVVAANRFLGRLLKLPQRMPQYAGISVALVGVKENELLWLNSSAAAFEAGDYPLHKQLREHFHNSIEMAILEGVNNGLTAAQAMEALELAWLPAAAELPAFLLENPASVSPLPDLRWFPPGADEELQVIAESSLPVIMRTNMERAPTGFNAVAGDHYRIGLVVSDDDYRPDLLQLPELETEVVELLHRKGRESVNATAASQIIWDELAAGFDPTLHPEIASVPERPPDPADPLDILASLASQSWKAKTAGATLTAPYSEEWPPPPDDLPQVVNVPEDPGDGLLVQFTEEIEREEDLSEMLEDIDDLLEMLEQEKKQQRGLVDALTIDLARLAGGIPGDGSGIKIASAAREIDLKTKGGS